MPRVGDRENMLHERVLLLEYDIRQLRLALRGALPHVPRELRGYPEKVLEDTRQ